MIATDSGPARTRKMMLSFVPQLDVRQASDDVCKHANKSPFQRFVHRSFVQIPPQTATAGEVLQQARAQLEKHLNNRRAYYGASAVPGDFRITGVWAEGGRGGRMGVAVPLCETDFMLSDAVVAKSHSASFGAPMPASALEDGLRFVRLPPDVSVELMRGLSLEERRRVAAASPYMQATWAQHVALDLPGDELYFEVEWV